MEKREIICDVCGSPAPDRLKYPQCAVHFSVRKFWWSIAKKFYGRSSIYDDIDICPTCLEKIAEISRKKHEETT